MGKRVVLIYHNDGPTDDRAFTYMKQAGFTLDVRRPFQGDSLETPGDDVAGSVVYGGPFVPAEEANHPFLRDEHRWIADCMEREIPLLGICQGAQSIAHVLGAKTGPRSEGLYEFGYYQVRPTQAGKELLPEPLHLSQSHFHEFETPKGAELLAESDWYPQQAFRYGTTTYAFQFHAEITPSGFRRWQEADWAHFGKPGAQTREEQNKLQAEHDDAQHRWFMGFLEKFFPKSKAAAA
jgi:GMP synthase (glutamine-hydrolysing)